MPPSRVRVLVRSPLVRSHLELLVDPRDDVHSLKLRIERVRGVPARRQRLAHGDVELRDPLASLGSYAIGEGSVLALAVAPPAGGACGRHAEAGARGGCDDSDLDLNLDLDFGQEYDCSLDEDEMELAMAIARAEESEGRTVVRTSWQRAPEVMSEEYVITKNKMIKIQNTLRELAAKRCKKMEERRHGSFRDAPSPAGDASYCESPRPRPEPPSTDDARRSSLDSDSHFRKKSLRCVACGRRLTCATAHTCACGGAYCAPHRYREAHACAHDYAEEGRARLREANPPGATAPKLPKI